MIVIILYQACKTNSTGNNEPASSGYTLQGVFLGKKYQAPDRLRHRVAEAAVRWPHCVGIIDDLGP